PMRSTTTNGTPRFTGNRFDTSTIRPDVLRSISRTTPTHGGLGQTRRDTSSKSTRTKSSLLCERLRLVRNAYVLSVRDSKHVARKRSDGVGSSRNELSGSSGTLLFGKRRNGFELT